MRKFSHTKVNPISIDRLVEICKAMSSMTRKQSFDFGKECGISKHNVDSIRQMLGYSNLDKYPRLTAEERDMIAEEYREGEGSMNELARRHGINYNSVRCILLARDVSISNPRKWDRRQEMYLRNEIRKGTPTSVIADNMGKGKKCIQMKIERMRRDDTILSEYRKGTSVSEIANLLGLGEKCVSELIRRMKRDGIIKEG